MGLLGGTNFESLDDLFLQQLEDLYDAEKRLVDDLPSLSDAADSPRLKAAFDQHLAETKQHVIRLEQVFQTIGKSPQRETCAAMKGLMKEASDMVSATGDAGVKDAALIAAAQRVEHYEIAGYGTLRTLAAQLGHAAAAGLLQQTLDEEGATDKKLTAIAESAVNPQAARA